VTRDHGLGRRDHLDLRRQLGLKIDNLLGVFEHDRRLVAIVRSRIYLAVHNRFRSDEMSKREGSYQGRFSIAATYRQYRPPHHAPAVTMGFVNVPNESALPWLQPEVPAGAVAGRNRELLDEFNDGLGALPTMRRSGNAPLRF
jgi:hypothetical protein